MARKLIEKHRRKPEFDPEGCVAIRLDDGQEWYFPRPYLEINPVFHEGKVINSIRCLTCGPELDLLIQMIGREDDALERIHKIMTLGAFLLLRNYDLLDNELAQLFVFRNKPEGFECLNWIMDVATGGLFTTVPEVVTDPKACAAGSGTA
jgi:hypothetical protein